jgi:hypothetical protein
VHSDAQLYLAESVALVLKLQQLIVLSFHQDIEIKTRLILMVTAVTFLLLLQHSTCLFFLYTGVVQ